MTDAELIKSLDGAEYRGNMSDADDNKFKVDGPRLIWWSVIDRNFKFRPPDVILFIGRIARMTGSNQILYEFSPSDDGRVLSLTTHYLPGGHPEVDRTYLFYRSN